MRAHTPTATSFAPYLCWRNSLSAADEFSRRFDEWLFLNASTVLLSEKTGELLALNRREFALSRADLETRLQHLGERWGFEARVLFESNDLIKFIVYRRDRLQAVLDEAPYCVMVGQLGYSAPLEAERFLAELQERWETDGAIPHEIGVALGYPLDDVFGYMGLLPLPCKGVCGWRVYGCMAESCRRSGAFQNARCQALVFLAQTAPARAAS
ncbi:MAG: DUF3793 family protein [Opitutales bacterium]